MLGHRCQGCWHPPPPRPWLAPSQPRSSLPSHCLPPARAPGSSFVPARALSPALASLPFAPGHAGTARLAPPLRRDLGALLAPQQLARSLRARACHSRSRARTPATPPATQPGFPRTPEPVPPPPRCLRTWSGRRARCSALPAPRAPPPPFDRRGRPGARPRPQPRPQAALAKDGPARGHAHTIGPAHWRLRGRLSTSRGLWPRPPVGPRPPTDGFVTAFSRHLATPTISAPPTSQRPATPTGPAFTPATPLTWPRLPPGHARCRFRGLLPKQGMPSTWPRPPA